MPSVGTKANAIVFHRMTQVHQILQWTQRFNTWRIRRPCIIWNPIACVYPLRRLFHFSTNFLLMILLLKQNGSWVDSQQFELEFSEEELAAVERATTVGNEAEQCRGTCVTAMLLLSMSLRSQSGWLDGHESGWPWMHHRASIIWYDGCNVTIIISIIICDLYQSHQHCLDF